MRRARLADGGLAEGTFQTQVLSLASMYQWRTAHFHDSRREVVRRGQRRLVGDHAAAGFPDLVLVRGPELIFAELKAEKGRPTALQREWVAALEQVAVAVRALQDVARPRHGFDYRPATVEVYIWRPSDWDRINRRLAVGCHLIDAPLAA